MATIGERLLSDHAFVTIEINMKEMCPTHRSWRLNNFLLESPGLEQQFRQEILDFYKWTKGSACEAVI